MLPEEIQYEIKTILTDSDQGWTTKQVEELITKESGIRYHSNHIYRILRRWGLKTEGTKEGSYQHCLCRREG